MMHFIEISLVQRVYAATICKDNITWVFRHARGFKWTFMTSHR